MKVMRKSKLKLSLKGIIANMSAALVLGYILSMLIGAVINDFGAIVTACYTLIFVAQLIVWCAVACTLPVVYDNIIPEADKDSDEDDVSA